MAAARVPVQIFGQRGGRPALYLHGAPGAPAEAALISSAAARQGIELRVIDRAAVASSDTAGDYLDRLTEAASRIDGGDRIPIIGFSIGAALALRVAARLGPQAGPLLLVAAAGPLDIPGAFDGMGAGAGMFRAAQANGTAFRLAVAAQRLMARAAPTVLIRLLFAGAERGDRAFAAAPAGRAALADVYTRAWSDGGRSYRRDLQAYVEPWSAEIARVAAPVELWHGRDDSWAPIGMARGIAARLTTVRLNEASGGHYSMLIGAARSVLAAAADPMAPERKKAPEAEASGAFRA